MRTVRRLLYRDIGWSVAFVAVAFLALFFFIDVVDELDRASRAGRGVGSAFVQALLELPGHFYELSPIAMLIGTIYSMARLAQSSEFTILRTAGLGPGRALRLLAVPGLIGAALTFVVGDYVAPLAERLAVLQEAGSRSATARGPGAWLRERRPATADEPEQVVSVHVAAADDDSHLDGIRIYQTDADGRLRRSITAARATVDESGTWQLEQAVVVEWPQPQAAREGAGIRSDSLPQLAWPSGLGRDVVAGALLPLKTMGTFELWRYVRHLARQDQAVQRHEIQFWKKALYPLACIVMVALALPFAYLHARAGGTSYKVFGGIMLGISFVLLNNASGHLGVLNGWTPWIAAAMPGLIYLGLSMAAFAWLVRYR
ncbi:MAG: hypothetical protein RIQ53_1865 [Pseudomonadota bacterium]|jgi:lipopolysaccharide export system permease protein